jgi:hypothetical protein
MKIKASEFRPLGSSLFKNSMRNRFALQKTYDQGV